MGVLVNALDVESSGRANPTIKTFYPELVSVAREYEDAQRRAQYEATA
jgi:hypothetical protein